MDTTFASASASPINSNPEAASKRSEQWNAKLAAVKTFAEKNKRWPSTTAKDPEEKSLAVWWSRVKYHANKEGPDDSAKGLSPDKGVKARELIRKFPSLERDGRWESKFHQIELRILAARTLWPQGEASAEQLKLIRWWNQQKTWARKFNNNEECIGMNPGRVKKIEDLLKFADPATRSTASE